MSGFDIVLLNSRRPFARSNSTGRALSSADRADFVRPDALPTKSFTMQKNRPQIFGRVAVFELRRFRHRNRERETPRRKKPAFKTHTRCKPKSCETPRSNANVPSRRPALRDGAGRVERVPEKNSREFPPSHTCRGGFWVCRFSSIDLAALLFLFVWRPGPVGSAPLPLPPSPGRRGPGAWDPALAG